MIRYIINKNALSKDFTPCDENCKNEKNLIGILEDPTFQMTLTYWIG